MLHNNLLILGEALSMLMSEIASTMGHPVPREPGVTPERGTGVWWGKKKKNSWVWPFVTLGHWEGFFTSTEIDLSRQCWGRQKSRLELVLPAHTSSTSGSPKSEEFCLPKQENQPGERLEVTSSIISTNPNSASLALQPFLNPDLWAFL